MDILHCLTASPTFPKVKPRRISYVFHRIVVFLKISATKQNSSSRQTSSSNLVNREKLKKKKFITIRATRHFWEAQLKRAPTAQLIHIRRVRWHLWNQPCHSTAVGRAKKRSDSEKSRNRLRHAPRLYIHVHARGVRIYTHRKGPARTRGPRKKERKKEGPVYTPEGAPARRPGHALVTSWFRG